MASFKRVVVVGAGVSGLATAALLARQGYKVTVLEKNAFLGGRASVFTQDGYFFDKGPSWYMMPEVFDNFFAIFGKKVADYYQLLRLKTHYKVFFDSGRTYTITSDMAHNTRQFEAVEAGAGLRLAEYLAESKYIYNEAMRDLVMFDYSSLKQLLQPRLLSYLFRFKLFTTLHEYVAQFVHNKDLQKILEFTTVFLGGSPYNTPAFYSLVAHADFNLGIYYPMGGMHAIVNALTSLCQEYGVTILTNHEVTDVIMDQGHIAKVAVGRTTIDADVVVCAMDYRNFEVQVIPQPFQSYPQTYWAKKTLSPGAFIIYVGINKKLRHVEHHNLYFDSSWESHFKHVFEHRSWPENPSYYVHMPSKTDPGVAPARGETLMFLVPVAPGLDDTETLRNDFWQKIVAHFERITGESIIPHIVVKRVYAHRDFISEYNAFAGSAFGLAHTLDQTAIFRPRNYSKKIKNLYYVGQYTNPGVGVPTCLLSAQITSKLIRYRYGQE